MSERALDWEDCLRPGWPVPARVRGLFTMRVGGVSGIPYGVFADGREEAGGLNLGLHTGDERDRVMRNRARLSALIGARPVWLEQVHGDRVVRADEVPEQAAPPEADASVTNVPGVACVVMVADCLPVLIADRHGRAVGAAHAGWRGLAAGVVEKTVERVAELAGTSASELCVWLGPAIGPCAFEVGGEVREAFMQTADASEQERVDAAFEPRPGAPGKYLADLYALARVRLARCGVYSISGGDACTVTQRERFYSYRRDGTTGRMAALVWLAD
ncbi:peptidoglycan editing factor PgeF [Trinickia caryophylli]|uniref:Purine nucleoside phosphorylase n=1 Tax=Trinickia caryophylli TaxID=28094 RepID=A0A1X7FXP2_TRICW|nr:peptidoglycan editing factor PgeF [Trinickia caryophylli]PMS11701.1 peptidoglycan editing factor PgeF [Trinickia caryophylli]TRX17378.1 peptidoglycan editing factor PgeF [Trinickia caryophylli]WQE11880.1 peptidoglycan editing factor PgeF [Trinickia caryophylli]SMF60615.1 conserved hypothetical protein [Trinickia caryophylli]GLU34615.1 laccase domain protein [Trinickia caryophylli]